MDRGASRSLFAAAMALCLACAVPAAAQGPIRYHYDEVGRLVGVTDAAGQSATYRYDAVGNLLQIARHAQSALSIIDFSPGGGQAGNTVAIAGGGFGAAPADNAVSFNGVPSAIVSATSTRIIAVVPAGATTGPISVTAPAGNASTADAFIVEDAKAPTISDFAPAIGGVGTVVAVTGTHYATSPGATRLSFNGRLAAADADNSSTLATVVPANSSSGRIVVATAHGVATSTSDFFVLPADIAAADVEVTGRMLAGQSKTIVIAAAGKKGLILFDAIAGQRVSLSLSGVSIASGSVSVIAPGGATIGTTSLAASGRFIDTMTLAATGTYTILVNPGPTYKGSVTLTLNPIHTVSAGISAGGAAATVTAALPGQNPELKFSGEAGQRVSLNMTAISATLGCPAVTVLKPDGSLLAAFSGYSCNPSYFFDALTLPLAGQYTVVVDPLKAGTGSATFTLYAIPPDAGITIAAGEAVTVTTSVPGQNASLAFSGAAGQRISVKVTAVSSSLNCPSYSLVNPDGTYLLAPESSCGSSYFYDAITLPADGQYKIVFDPRLMTTGAATFALFSVPPDVTAAIVAGGPSVKLTISAPGQDGTLAFSGAAAQRISVNVTAISSSMGCSKFSIVKPDGGMLMGPATACGATYFIDTTTLPTAGPYTIVMDPSAAGTGSATFAMYDVPESSRSIVVGAAPSPVAIAVPGQNMDLTFNGTEGQKVTVRITSNTVGCQAYSLRKPDGGVQFSSTSCSANVNLAQQTLATSGIHTVRIDPSAARTGGANVAITSP